MSFGLEATGRYGRIRADLEKRGATLATNNTRELKRVPGLRIEGWATSE